MGEVIRLQRKSLSERLRDADRMIRLHRVRLDHLRAARHHREAEQYHLARVAEIRRESLSLAHSIIRPQAPNTPQKRSP